MQAEVLLPRVTIPSSTLARLYPRFGSASNLAWRYETAMEPVSCSTEINKPRSEDPNLTRSSLPSLEAVSIVSSLVYFLKSDPTTSFLRDVKGSLPILDGTLTGR